MMMNDLISAIVKNEFMTTISQQIINFTLTATVGPLQGSCIISFLSVPGFLSKMKQSFLNQST